MGVHRWARLTSYAALVCLSVPGMITLAATPAAAAVFSATLDGAQVVPPNAVAGTGTGSVTLNPTETQITVDLSWTGLTAALIGVHIRGPAPPGVNASIRFDFTALAPKTTAGMHNGQVVDVLPFQVDELKAGLWYFSISTPSNPGGEIRGQIGGSPPAPQLFVATLRGSQEVPQTAVTAAGRGLFTLNPAQTEITFTLSFTGLTGNLVGAHIHGSALPGVNAPILIDFTALAPKTTAGVLTNQVFAVTPQQVSFLKAGQLYFNIHTSLHPGGEIRGQIIPALSWPGVVRGSTEWRLRSALSVGDPTVPSFQFGVRPLVPLTGDWDGNGSKTPAILKNGHVQLSNTLSANPTFLVPVNDPRGFPLAGDFDGNGIDDLAVFRNGSWWVRYSDGTTTTFTFGSDAWPKTIPVAGDWDGDGVDGIGTYTPATATWSLRQTASAGGADAGTIVFGTPFATYPVVGDWNGDGVDSIGLKATQGAGWSLRNVNTGPVEISFDYGAANDLPITWRVSR